MARTMLNSIDVRYEVHGSGPPLLMMAPGGFEGAIAMWGKWWARVKPIETFSQRYTCIAYDRREAGESGGRVERLSWDLYALEARELLDHLGIAKAFVIGGCMGCPVAMAFGVNYPERTAGLILHYPTGGAKWRISQGARFAEHAAFVDENGVEGVVKAVREDAEEVSYYNRPLLGPWAGPIYRDEEFARRFAAMDSAGYGAMIRTLGRSLFDRDTFPGATPEEVMAMKAPALIIPGDDAAHAMSAARYLQALLPNNKFHDEPVSSQARLLAGWILDWLDEHAHLAEAVPARA